MWSILALGAAERLVNQFINLDAITRIQLNDLHGKILRVVLDSPQLSVDVFFDQHKVRLEPTVTGHSETASIFEQRPFDQAQTVSAATATLHVSTLIDLIKLLLAEDVGNIPLQGDYHLLQDIQKIIQQTEPDLAAKLSPWISPALAHEIAKIQLAPKYIKRALHSHWFFAADFIKEDTGLLAARWQMNDLSQSTRQLNQNLDRLEAKIQQLQSQIHSIQD